MVKLLVVCVLKRNVINFEFVDEVIDELEVFDVFFRVVFSVF